MTIVKCCLIWKKKTIVEPFFRNGIECLSVPRWNICFQFSTLFELERLTRERLSVIFFFFAQICHCQRRERIVWLDWIWNNFFFNQTQTTFFRSLKVKSISRLKLLQLALSCFSFWSEIIFYNIFLINERFKKNIFLINERLNVKRIKTRFYNNEKRKQHSRTGFSW